MKKFVYPFVAPLFRFHSVRRLYALRRFERPYASNPRWDIGKPPEELVELVEDGVVKPCRAVDLGCGRGHTVRYLHSMGFDAWGIDISALAIRQAKEASSSMDLSSHFIRADALSYVPKRKFNLAIDVGFFHNFPEGERRRLAGHVYARYLEAGGRLLLWCRNSEHARSTFGVSKGELLTYFSDRWEILRIQESDTLETGTLDYYFMHALLKN